MNNKHPINKVLKKIKFILEVMIWNNKTNQSKKTIIIFISILPTIVKITWIDKIPVYNNSSNT